MRRRRTLIPPFSFFYERKMDVFPRLHDLVAEATASRLAETSFGNGCGGGYRCYKELYVGAMASSMMLVLSMDSGFPVNPDPPFDDVTEADEAVLHRYQEENLDLPDAIARIVPRWRALFLAERSSGFSPTLLAITRAILCTMPDYDVLTQPYW